MYVSLPRWPLPPHPVSTLLEEVLNSWIKHHILRPRSSASSVLDNSSIHAQLNRSNYINLVAFVILYYDYTLTLSAEDYERGLVTTFAKVSSSTMISRLMLNLRDPNLLSAYGVALEEHYYLLL
ncbi:hypothetical protein LshimejAT787_0804380 [Lyophyllum shimeji]|uniref:Uncharacterized protein n=1 Tax=Lyophyllum shimeji TaxID=47721 RepID=A0A9P3PQ40_LYOSH|nr:hypothetical protein LshimejAT787_0804380 [Lyophyllum shimeji]